MSKIMCILSFATETQSTRRKGSVCSVSLWQNYTCNSDLVLKEAFPCGVDEFKGISDQFHLL